MPEFSDISYIEVYLTDEGPYIAHPWPKYTYLKESMFHSVAVIPLFMYYRYDGTVVFTLLNGAAVYERVQALGDLDYYRFLQGWYKPLSIEELSA